MKVLTESEANEYILNGSTTTFKIGELANIYYKDLVKIFGHPTFNYPIEDEKTQVEWWIKFEGNLYLIYDWETYNKDFTLNGLDVWTIGGNSNPDKLIEFIYNKMDH